MQIVLLVLSPALTLATCSTLLFQYPTYDTLSIRQLANPFATVLNNAMSLVP